MTTPTNSEAKDLIALAERMGIPADEAVRQVAQLMELGPTVEKRLIKLGPPLENGEERQTFCAVDVVAMTGG